MTYTRIAVTIAVLAVAAPTFAQERAPRKPFAGMDRDNSGTITRQEWTLAPEAFDRRDANKDGVLAAEELQRRGKRGARGARTDARQSGPLDADRNGVISRQEWRRNPAVFDRLDRNKDGSLSVDELARPPRKRRAVR